MQLRLRAAALLTIRDVVRVWEQRAAEALSEDERLFPAQRLETALFVEDYTRGLQQGLRAGM